MKIQLSHKFEDIICLENLLSAWQEFSRGKRGRKDVQEFSLNLMDNIFSLREDLLYHTYRHGGYEAFKINDPKPRDIHKASVRDRLLHHAVYRVLYSFFQRTFIADSYSCQINKGTHKALDKFREFAYKIGKNNTQTVWVLKGDIRKFFASIDHNILLMILNEYIPDKNIIWLLEKIIKSFSVSKTGVGLPLGNLTSQLLVNIYLNKFDQFVKHSLSRYSHKNGNPMTHPGASRHPCLSGRQASQEGIYYIRYADDFVIFSESKKRLEDFIPAIRNFLSEELKLELHPDKIFIKTIASGVDFLGWVNFPDHRVLRTKTKKRMLKKIKETGKPETIDSYRGLLKHGNTRRILEYEFLPNISTNDKIHTIER